MSVTPTGPRYYPVQFWIELLEIQLLEMKVDVKNGDYNHAVKEACDVISVAQDMIRMSFGRDALFEQNKRFAENLAKWDPANLQRRDEKFYADKKAKLKAELGEAAECLCPSCEGEPGHGDLE